MDDDAPSKSARKREATDVQKLGEALLELTDEELDRLIGDERLRGAFAEMRRLTSKEARRNQHARESAAFKDIQRWRERLIADDASLDAWMAQHPGSDTAGFRTLVRDARREQETGRDKRAFRELFQAIGAVLKHGAR